VQIRTHEDRGFLTCRFANGADARVRDRTAKECHVAHARQAKVPDEAAAPTQQPRVLLAQDARTDAFT
jgi:hypothetical protein